MSDAEDETIRRAADIIRRDYGKASFRAVLEERFGPAETPEEESETDADGNPKPPPVKDEPNNKPEERKKKSIWWPAAEEEPAS